MVPLDTLCKIHVRQDRIITLRPCPSSYTMSKWSTFWISSSLNECFRQSCVWCWFACFRLVFFFMFNTVLCMLPLFSSYLLFSSYFTYHSLCPPVDFRSCCAELTRDVLDWIGGGGVIYLVVPQIFLVFVFSWTYEQVIQQLGPPHLLCCVPLMQHHHRPRLGSKY